MDWDDTPCALNTELLKECSGNDGFGGDKRIWVQESTANDADDNDGEATAKNLGAITDNSTSCHGAKIGNDLGYSDQVSAEAVLVLQ